MYYESALLNALYAKDTIESVSGEMLHVKENLLGGISGTTTNGGVIFETMPNAMGGETVMFSNGETGHLSENISGGLTLDMQGIENDVVSNPGIFGSESVHQGGEFVGVMQPNLMGSGFTLSGNEGSMSASPDILGGANLQFTPPLVTPDSYSQGLDLHDQFSVIDSTISTSLSAGDLASVSDGLDLLDLL